MSSYPLTVVSGSWDFSQTVHFPNTLRIRAPYVFFGTAETIREAKTVRSTMKEPTYYVELPLTEISHEKIFLLKRAVSLNLFNSDWFAWVNADLCVYRNSPPPSDPFPNPSVLKQCSKEKVLFTTSDNNRFDPSRVGPTSDYHCIAGDAYLLHASIVHYFASLYDSYLNRFPRKQGSDITDQVLWTHILSEHPEFFQALGHGYGQVVPLLY
jgi:hypothetical protein